MHSFVLAIFILYVHLQPAHNSKPSSVRKRDMLLPIGHLLSFSVFFLHLLLCINREEINDRMKGENCVIKGYEW